MKRILLIFSALLASAVMLQSCYKDVIHPGADPDAPPQPVSFSGDIVPIFDKSCNTSGCHDAIPTKKPNLTSKNAYASLMGGGYVNTIAPDKSGIYLSVKDNSMPIGGSITNSEKRKILDWIRNGAPNN